MSISCESLLVHDQPVDCAKKSIRNVVSHAVHAVHAVARDVNQLLLSQGIDVCTTVNGSRHTPVELLQVVRDDTCDSALHLMVCGQIALPFFNAILSGASMPVDFPGEWDGTSFINHQPVVTGTEVNTVVGPRCDLPHQSPVLILGDGLPIDEFKTVPCIFSATSGPLEISSYAAAPTTPAPIVTTPAPPHFSTQDVVTTNGVCVPASGINAFFKAWGIPAPELPPHPNGYTGIFIDHNAYDPGTGEVMPAMSSTLYGLVPCSGP
ncbi:MAG: hypothetical protein ACOCXT_02680 [Candidatus Dojkabacteria bacterium]